MPLLDFGGAKDSDCAALINSATNPAPLPKSWTPGEINGSELVAGRVNSPAHQRNPGALVAPLP